MSTPNIYTILINLYLHEKYQRRKVIQISDVLYCQKLACSPLLLSSQFKRRTIKEIRILSGSLPCPPGHMPATCSSVILSRIVFVVARQSHKWIMFKYLQFCISIGRHISAPLPHYLVTMSTADGTRPRFSRLFSYSSSLKTFFGKFVMNFTAPVPPSVLK